MDSPAHAWISAIKPRLQGAAFVRILAGMAVCSLTIAMALLPLPFGPEHAFAIFGTLTALFAVHRSLTLRQSSEKLDDRIAGRIEQLKDLQWEISENQARYRDLLDSQDDMILRRDGTGRLTYANKAFCRAFNIAPEAVIANRFTPSVLAFEAVNGVEMQGNPRRRRFAELIETHNGPRWIEWEEQSVANGSTDEIQSIGRDVTERRQAREDLEVARDRAEAANRAKSRFLAAMSHEIRTPMNGIMGMASLLMETCDTPDKQTYVRAIDQSARNLLVVIDEILDYSKIEAGKLTLSSEPFRIADTIQSAVELMATRAHEKGLEIAWSVDTAMPSMVAGDEARIRQILLNLVSNAVKFTDAGGVVISAKHLGSTTDGEVKLSITVQDTGIGLSDEDKKRLFDEFEQADAAIRRQSGGTGLGLAISRRLSRAMGGDIRVDSQAGKGSIFTADLTLKSACEHQLTHEDETAPDTSISVLLAFDRPLERRSLSAGLSALGIKTIETSFDEAEHALERAARDGHPVDRIVVEVNSDPMKAADLLHAAGTLLEAAGRTASEAKGIVLVNVLSRSSLSAFRAHGFMSYIVRPVRPASILEQLGVRKKPVKALHPQKATAPIAGSTRPRVLLVEDNDINELLARHILEKSGCEVTSARNGATAVSLMSAVHSGEEPPFQIILMDILLPGMDGVEATQKIRAMFESAPETITLPPIVALTANAFVEDRKRYIDAGMVDYLAKPFDTPAINALLIKWLGLDGIGEKAA